MQHGAGDRSGPRARALAGRAARPPRRRARTPGRDRPGGRSGVRQSAHATAEGRSLPAIPSPSGGAEPSNGRICRRSPATTTASSVPVNACSARLRGPSRELGGERQQRERGQRPEQRPGDERDVPARVVPRQGDPDGAERGEDDREPERDVPEREERHREGERERDPGEGEPERRGCDRQPERPARRVERERPGDPAGPDRRGEGGRARARAPRP